ncbi:MAG: GtrA family protein [Pseudomonadota bacterium]
MEDFVLSSMGENEERHWWNRARRAIVARLISRFCGLPKRARILEAGCGTGGNLEMLQEFGVVESFEIDDVSRKTAVAKSGLDIPYGVLPDGVPKHLKDYNLITALDVIEHVEEDVESMQALATRLAEDGKILVTVPAMPWLWSHHDVLHHHFRRYTKRSFAKVVDQAGLHIAHIGYYNFILFPAAAAKRLYDRYANAKYSDIEVPPFWLNALFYFIFKLERLWIGHVPMPIGVSLFVIVQKERVERSTNPLMGQIARFGVVGVIATAIHIMIAYFVQQSGVADQLANFTGFLAAAVFSFFGNLLFTFRAKGSVRNYIKRFAVVSGSNYFASAGLIFILTQQLGFPFEISLLGMVLIIPAISFLVQKLWVFRR